MLFSKVYKGLNGSPRAWLLSTQLFQLFCSRRPCDSSFAKPRTISAALVQTVCATRSVEGLCSGIMRFRQMAKLCRKHGEARSQSEAIRRRPGERYRILARDRLAHQGVYGRSGSGEPGGGLGGYQPGPAQGSGPPAAQPVDQADPGRRVLPRHRHARSLPADRIQRELGAGPLCRPAVAGVEDRARRSAHRQYPGPSRPPSHGGHRHRQSRHGGGQGRHQHDRGRFRRIARGRLRLVRRPRPVADLCLLRQRRDQCAGPQCRRTHGRQRDAAILAALSQGRHRTGQDAPAARDRPRLSRPPSARAHLLLQRRTLHGRIRPGAESQPDDGVQGAPAQFRPVAGGRYPVHHRQGKRAGGTALHHRRAAGRGQAAGVRRRPRAAGAGRGGATPAQPPVDGAGRRYPARRYRIAPQDPGIEADPVRAA